MKKLVILLFAIFLVLGISEIIKSQNQFPYNFTCGTNAMLMAPTVKSLTTPFEGYLKPNRTDTINGVFNSSYAYFPVLIVFVQFKDDPSTDIWPNVCDTSGPTYKNTMISPYKHDNSNWWEAYNRNIETISDYYLQSSRGRMHVIGDAYSIVLDSNASYYISLGYMSESVMTADIWKKLNRIYPIDWPKYDKWGWDNANNTFKYEKDSIVDFIYKIHKTRGDSALPDYGGYTGLGGGADFEVDTVNHIRINHGYGVTGSGITSIKNQTKNSVFGVVNHEHAHYTYSWGHMTYSKLCYGVGFDTESPYDKICNKYMTPRDAVFGQTNVLGDFSSRNSGSGEIIKVPITETEFFLLASRRKVSPWDRVMFGDTAAYNPYNDWEYGKGLYIYHVFNGIQPPSATYSVPQDMESADGYYRWDTVGKQSVYLNCWTSDPTWWVYKKAEVLYTNDPSTLGTTGSFTGDELSLHHLIGWNDDGSPAGMTHKFSIGKNAVDNCHLGTDRIYANETEFFTNFNHAGTRWDPWNVGYNEVFSPYSSPSTGRKNDRSSGIFIWYRALNTSTNEASIDIYRTGYGGYNESQILQLTPPSRPMGVNVDYWNYWGDVWHPRITWNQNQEPDMVSDLNGKKKYRIYRATKSYMNQIPGPPQIIADNVEFYPNETPYYIDYQVLGYLSPISGDDPWLYPVRYWVKAVDKYADSSVYSDFAGAIGINDGSYINPGGNDNSSINGNIPKKFDLYQNYPNPFNPVTNIQYDLPKDVFVSIKIYDLLGREIKTLVNEYKNAGSYIVNFNGSELSSGVYFYRINAGSFNQVKRMVLIK
jgi:hypothetical protein